MLPTTFVAVAILLELCSSSPVYNLQPAFITGNIGTGRNLRNLPCVTRRNNQKGVCMFAIDCVKANGTHLGTCIDRFYFGSCCHLESRHEVVDNNIDTALIPHREPPSRVGNTTRKPETTTRKPVVITTTQTPEITTQKTPTTKIPITTTTKKVFSSKIPTTKVPTTTEAIATTTEISYRLTTFQTVDGNLVINESTTTIKPTTTIRAKPTKPTSKPFIDLSTKPTSKPFIDLSTKPTSKPFTDLPISSKPITTKPVTTSKPKPIGTRPSIKPTGKPSVKPTIKPKPPPSTTSKPVKLTRPTLKPIVTTVKPIKPTKNVTKPLKVSTTQKPPTTKLTTVRPSNFTKRPTTIRTTVTEKISLKPTTAKVTTVKPPTTTTLRTTEIPSTKFPEVQANVTVVTENSTVNEIEPASKRPIGETSTKPAPFVTWAVVDEKPTAKPTENASVSEDWMPLTTPDGWVLLPILTSTVSPNDSTEVPMTTANVTGGESTTGFGSTEPSLLTTISSTVTDRLENVTTVSPPISPVSEVASTTSAYGPGVNMSDFTNVCGRRMFPEARIVGGESASFGKWPWQISLRQWRTSTYLHKCGAALLNENWAITAAHCVDNVPPSDLLLRLGEHDLSTESEPYLHQERRVQIVASHPQFDPRTFEYDLALLRFYQPVQFQPNIIPVCVPESDENFVGRTAYVTGWGRLYEDGPLPSVLQQVSVPVINNTECESMYRNAGYIEHIPHIFICAGWRKGGYDSCEGDSGGPMVIQRPDSRFLLAGVISWGIGCAEPNQPGVYTRISEFRDWINQILQF